MVRAGDRVRFTASLSNGGYATWYAKVVAVVGGIAKVRHPQQARTFPFSPVPARALYLYRAESLERGIVNANSGGAPEVK